MPGRRWQEHDLQTLDEGLDRSDRYDDQYHHIDDQDRAIGDRNEPFMHDGHPGTCSNTSSRSAGQNRPPNQYCDRRLITELSASSGFDTSLSFRLLEACSFALKSVLPQGIVDWRVAHQSWYQHGHETGPQHRQKHCYVCRHLDDKGYARQRSSDDTGEKGGHSDNGESFRFNVQIWKYKLTELTEEQSQLGTEYKHGGKQTPRRPRCIR